MDWKQLALELGVSPVPGGIRGIGDPYDPRRNLGGVPQARDIVGLPAASAPYGTTDELIVRPGIEGLLAGSRRGKANYAVERDLRLSDPRNPEQQRPRRDSRMLQQQRYVDEPIGLTSVLNPRTGQWLDQSATGGGIVYQPGDTGQFDRKPRGLAALTSGAASTAEISDPQMIGSNRVTWLLGNLEVLDRGGPAVGPAMDIAYADYQRGMARERDTADLSANANVTRGDFTSEDPTLSRLLSNSTAQPSPYGVVQMPAINNRGQWRDGQGRPLMVTVDPSAVVEVRTANPDATYTADQTEEVTLGQRVRESREANRTPVMTASRLNELMKQGRARRTSGGEGTAVGEVDRYDIEDRGIYRAPDGQTYVAPAPAGQGFEPPADHVLVGVKRAVPVQRTETIYAPVDRFKDPVTTTVQQPDGLLGVQEAQERLYRIGNPTATDMDAVRAEIAPLIPKTGVAGTASRVSLYQLLQALGGGGATYSDLPRGAQGVISAAAEGSSPLASFSEIRPGLAGGEASRLGTLLSGSAVYDSSQGVLPLPNQGNVYVNRRGESNLVVPRQRPDGSLVGDFLVANDATRRPVGAAPFLTPLPGATEEQARVLGGLRRNAEKMEGGMRFDQLLNELAAGQFMEAPRVNSGMTDILAAIDSGVPIEQIAKTQTSRQLIENALAERRASEVNLFAEQPLSDLEVELAKRQKSVAEQMGVQGVFERGESGYSLSAGPDAGSAASDLGRGVARFDRAVAQLFPNAKPSERALLVDQAWRSASEQLRGVANQRLRRSQADRLQAYVDGVVADTLNRPVTVVNDPSVRVQGFAPPADALQLAVPGLRVPAPRAGQGGEEPLDLTGPSSDIRYRQLPLPVVDPGALPPAVREGLERPSGTPANIAAMEYAQRIANQQAGIHDELSYRVPAPVVGSTPSGNELNAPQSAPVAVESPQRRANQLLRRFLGR